MAVRHSRFVLYNHNLKTPGGGTDLDPVIYRSTKDPWQVYIAENSNLGVPAMIVGYTPQEVLDFPEFTRDMPARKYDPWAAYKKRGDAFKALMSASYGMGIPAVDLNFPIDETVVALGKQDPQFPQAHLMKKRQFDFAKALRASNATFTAFPGMTPASTYSTQVCQMFDEIQRHMLEDPNGGASWGSGLWTVSEVVNYLNHRVSNFLMETCIIQDHRTIAVVAGTDTYDLPADWILLKRVAFRPTGGTMSELPRLDTWTADNSVTTWDGTAGTVAAYVEVPNPSLQIRLYPVPASAGTVDIIGVANPAALTNDCSIIPLPDEWAVYVKWGVMADMFAKEGEANDPDRAAFCESRYGEGILLARLYLGTEERPPAQPQQGGSR